MTNREIRLWYLEEVAKIPEFDEAWAKRGDSLERRARQAWQRRHELRLRAREMMLDPREVAGLRDRDQQLYGNPDGPGFEDLVEKLHSRGLSDEDAYELILKRAQATNEPVNRLFDV